ncbi:glyoxalase [Acetomicrobium hydrogeniformans]|uniref:Uncharacterized protein n=1 Tax=Acetomicrobium hydrogeniformans ATCC BAA-1850 TaxID=592015 RepID=D3L0M8_9BACT|nr:glyoxalase [Acetomicrobium hydrogeniformans]KRT34333.1 hypothetical protein HMPREF1705_04750 [Acetomicrobium hydrogeniformans ATCC BAA-1850]
MTYPFEKIHHIRIAVDDIDEKVKNFESIGIGIKLFFASPFSPVLHQLVPSRHLETGNVS